MEIEKYYKQITKDGGDMLIGYIFYASREEYKFIEDNFQDIYDKISPKNRYSFIYLLSYLSLKDVLKKNFKYIIQNAKGAGLPIELLIDLAPNSRYIANNLDNFLDSSVTYTMFRAIDKLKKVKGVDKNRIHEFIKENKGEYVKAILNDCLERRMKDDWNIKQKEVYKYVPSFVIIIEELLQNEKKDWIDIEEKNEGTYLTAYQIGDKILKIGIPGEQYNMPNHRRFLQPLLRKEIMKKSISVVIQEKIEPCELNAEELYQIYKELRDDGIFVTDFKPNNFGITKKPNRVHFDGIEEVAPEAAGFDKNIDLKDVLPAGEAVLFDLDYCFSEKDLDDPIKGVEKLPWPSDIAVDFEKRYRKERGLKPLFTDHIMDSTLKYFFKDKFDIEID